MAVTTGGYTDPATGQQYDANGNPVGGPKSSSTTNPVTTGQNTTPQTVTPPTTPGGPSQITGNTTPAQSAASFGGTVTGPYTGPANPAPTPPEGYDPTAPNPLAVSGGSNVWKGEGGGWAQATGPATVLEQALAMGLTGQAAVDWATAHGGTGIEYYANGDYGIPGNQYAAPNAQGTLDLIQKGAGGGGGGGGAVTPAYQANPSTALPNDAEVNAEIQKLLAEGNTPVGGPNDTQLQQQFAPQAAVMERQQQLQDAQAAETGAAQGTQVGGGAGSTSGVQQSIAENTGSAEGQLMSQLVQSEIQQRMTQVTNALQFAQGEDAQQLQLELANLTAALQQEQMAIGVGEFSANQTAPVVAATT
jgi:hypothetical protein